MKYTCLKNFHRFLPFFPALYINKRDFLWKVSFDETCRYGLKDNDQYDWNKLVGLSEYLNPRKSSVRLAWRYNLESKLIEIGYFIEKDYQIESEMLCNVEPGKEVEVEIKCNYKTTTVRAGNNFVTTGYTLNNYIFFKAHPYFGGNKKAPHKMSLTLTKIS